MASHQHFKVFLASSNDVKAERDRVEGVIARLNKIVGAPLARHLDLYRWETHAVPGLDPGGAQQLINPDLDDSDVIVLVCWSRLGEGVTEEIERSLARWKRTGAPRVMPYFCARPWPQDVDLDHLARVRKLKADMGQQGLYAEYQSVDDFAEQLFDHLSTVLPKLGAPPPASAAAAASAPAGAAATTGALSRAEVARVVDIALRHRADRDLLLGFLPDGITATLPDKSNRLEQLQSDVGTLNPMAPIDGERPIVTWLRNLHQRVAIFPEGAEVDALLKRLG